MKFPVATTNGGVPAVPNEIDRVIANASAGIAAASGTNNAPLLIFQARPNVWTYNREPLDLDDCGLLVVDYTRLCRGYVEWIAKSPVQSIFVPLVSDKIHTLTEADLPRRINTEAYRASGDGVQETWQINGGFLDTGDAFRFESSSYGGRAAAKAVATSAQNALIACKAIMHPVIELGSTHYDHAQYGKTYNPTFRIVGFIAKARTDAGEVTEDDIVPEAEVAKKAKAAAPAKPTEDRKTNARRGGSAL